MNNCPKCGMKDDRVLYPGCGNPVKTECPWKLPFYSISIPIDSMKSIITSTSCNDLPLMDYRTMIRDIIYEHDIEQSSNLIYEQIIMPILSLQNNSK